MRTVLCYGVVAAFTVVPSRGFGQVAPVIESNSTSGVTLKLSPCYSGLPAFGLVPLTLHIENHRSHDGVWYLSSNASPNYDGSHMHYETAVDVAHGRSRDVEVLVPMPPAFDLPHLWRDIELVVDGPDIHRNFGHLGAEIPSPANPRRTVLLTPALSSLVERFRQIDGRDIAYLVGAPECLPVDTRAYLGIDAVWTTLGELENMRPEARSALEDHVYLGGQLGVFVPQKDERRPLLSFASRWETMSHGMGELHIVTGEPQSERSATDFYDGLLHGPRRTSRLFELGPIDQVYPPMAVKRGSMLSILILFALVVGPLNVFVFARRARRARLIWTTPALSLGASLLLSMTIFIEEDIGGKGLRQSLVLLAPERHLAHVLQVQTSRTGLLVFPRVDTPAGSYMDFLPAKTKFSGDYTFASDRMTGDWFRTRRVQKHWLYQPRSTRARIELVDRAPTPTLVSSVDTTFSELFYFDGQRYWHVTDVAPGQRVVLEAATSQAFDEWRLLLEKYTHPLISQAWNKETEGWFYASVKEPRTQIIPSLKQIAWDDHAVWAGPVTHDLVTPKSEEP